LAQNGAVAECDSHSFACPVAGQGEGAEIGLLLGVDELELFAAGDLGEDFAGDGQSSVDGVGGVDVTERETHGVEASAAAADELDAIEDIDNFPISEDVAIVVVVFGQESPLT
jgi:hypothetical protein